MKSRVYVLSVLALLVVVLLAGQSRVRDWTKTQPPPPPMDLRTLSVPKSQVPQAELYSEADFRRRIDVLAREWNRWLDMRAEQDESEHTLDLAAICKERQQLEKITKLLDDLRTHRSSPCTRCPDDTKKDDTKKK